MKTEYKSEKEVVQTIDLNIVILPDESVSQTLIKWSEQIASQFSTAYTLNRIDKLPHFSLYSARYPIKNQDAIEKQVRTIAAMTNSFPITLSGFSVFSGYLFYDAKKNKALMNLHNQIVDALNPLREGLITDNQRQLTGLSTEQQRAIEKFGYVSVGKLYMPHISITKMIDSHEARQALALLPNMELTFKATKVAIAFVGAYGTCPQPLKVIELK